MPDTNDDGRLCVGEFKLGMEILGIELSDAEAAAEFAKMDANSGGKELFDEFCLYAALKQCHDLAVLADDIEEGLIKQTMEARIRQREEEAALCPVCGTRIGKQRVLPRCKHALEVTCHQLELYTKTPSLARQCTADVQFVPPCGHAVKLKCYVKGQYEQGQVFRCGKVREPNSTQELRSIQSRTVPRD